jgi:hypothetical protein
MIASITLLPQVATMTFRAGPSMLSVRTGCSAVALLERGNPRQGVLVVGGLGGDCENLNTTEVLDLDTMTFSRGKKHDHRIMLMLNRPDDDARGTMWMCGRGPKRWRLATKRLPRRHRRGIRRE